MVYKIYIGLQLLLSVVVTRDHLSKYRNVSLLKERMTRWVIGIITDFTSLRNPCRYVVPIKPTICLWTHTNSSMSYQIAQKRAARKN